MAKDRVKLKAEIKMLKKNLVKYTSYIAASDSVSLEEVALLDGVLGALVAAQRNLNATYQALDERTILERVAKRRKNLSA